MARCASPCGPPTRGRGRPDCRPEPSTRGPQWRGGTPALAELVAIEGEGEELAERAGRAVAVDEEVGTAVLEEELPAPAARHRGLAVGRHDGHGDEAAAAAV